MHFLFRNKHIMLSRINNRINTYNSISWNGLSQTVHLVSPSSSSSLSSSIVPLCCEAVNDKYNADHKCSRLTDLIARAKVAIPFAICVCVCVCMNGHNSINYYPLQAMIRDPSLCGRITWSRTARGPQEWRDKWTRGYYSWIIKLKRRCISPDDLTKRRLRYFIGTRRDFN